MQNQLISFLLFGFLLFKIDHSYSQTTTKKSKANSSVLTEVETNNIIDKTLSDSRREFTIIDSTLNFRGIKLGSDLPVVNQFLRIQNIKIDSKMHNHKYGLINNNQFCKIDTFSLIGFADFIDEKLVQISFESMNEYKYVASYFVRYFGMPDQYNDFSIIWTGRKIKMTVTDNAKVKDKSSIIGYATININLLN